MSFVVGEGTRIHFWHDRWIGDNTLKDLYPELYVCSAANYVARVSFGIRVRVRVRVRDSAIFEKSGCGCGGTRQLKNIFIYIFNILLNIFFHIIQTYTKFNVSEM